MTERNITGTRGAMRRAAACLLAAALCAAAGGAAAAVSNADGGIEFTYYSPGAVSVYLAGSFNGWNATQLAMTNDGKGTWSIVHELPAGRHEYKFVVDGAWFADPDNPDTQPDPYGGANSLVVVGADGKLVSAAPAGTAGGAAASAQRPRSNTPLNARVYIGGRYLTRYEFVKNTSSVTETNPGDAATAVDITDPRYRLQRPLQSADLNFFTTVSDIVDSYTRLRLDSRENIIQNNIAAYLDEADVHVHPDKFDLRGYWNMEVFTLGDPYRLGGDIDLPGTILDDHLNSGKGTAGALFNADPHGVHVQGYLADVHDANYYNNPDLYDDTGRDLYGFRLSRPVGPVELGVPLYATRDLIWMSFTDLVGGTGTGIPRLDSYLNRTGDTSDWYEVERLNLRLGLDLKRSIADGRGAAYLEWLYGKRRQALVTGNRAGVNLTNGAIDVPVLDRDLKVYHARLDLDFGGNKHLNAENTLTTMSGGDPNENAFDLVFEPQDVANKHIFFTVEPAPPVRRELYSEATLTWGEGPNRRLIWLQRRTFRDDYGTVDLTAPADSTVSIDHRKIWTISGRAGVGVPERTWGHWELETAFTFDRRDVLDARQDTREFILRAERKVSRRVSLIADVRYIHYDVETTDRESGATTTILDDYFNPYGGLRYVPNPKVELVVAYGVDPLKFGIDYDGRQIGRWWFRQEAVFDNPDLTELGAEQYLEDARVFGIRAQLKF